MSGSSVGAGEKVFDFILGNEMDRKKVCIGISNVCRKVKWTGENIAGSLEGFFAHPEMSIFACDKERNVLGYVVMKPWESKTGKKNRFYISYLAIDPEYQGKKVGKELVNKIIDIAKRMGAVKVKVDHDMDLLGFYEKCTSLPHKLKDTGIDPHREDVVFRGRMTYNITEHPVDIASIAAV